MRVTKEFLAARGYNEDGTRKDATHQASAKAHKPKGKPSKYRNVRTEYRGYTYDSNAEACRAALLDMLLAAGKILAWRRQPRYTLGCPENVYVADFEVTRLDGTKHTEDVKGMETAKFRKDKVLWRKYGQHALRVLKRKGRSRWEITIVLPDGQKGQEHE